MWVLCPFFIPLMEWATPMLWQEKIPAYDVFILPRVWCWNDAVLTSAGSCGNFTELLPVSQLSTGLPNPTLLHWALCYPSVPLWKPWILISNGWKSLLSSDFRYSVVLDIKFERFTAPFCTCLCYTYNLCCFQCNQSTLPKCGANHRLNPKIWDWLAWLSVCMLNHWQG